MRRISRSRSESRGRSRSRGQALVEFALLMPLFALVLFGLLDFGRVIYAQNAVSEAAREASRIGTLEPSQTTAKYDAMRNAAITRAPGIGLTTADVIGNTCSNCFYPDGAVPGGRVVVRVSKAVTLVTPIISQIVGGSFTVSSTSRAFIQ
jgi:Flp pilus assembly protein TadG